MPIYEYKGQQYELKDGLSNEEALAKIKGHLGETEAPKPVAEAAPESSVLDGLKRGVGLAARAGVTGFSAPVNMVADAGAGAFNIVSSLFGSDARLPFMSQKQQQGMDNLGVPRAETLPEKALTGGIEALSGAGAVNAVAAPVRAAAPLMTTTAPQVASVAAGGATAPVAHDVIKDITGSEIAATAGAFGLSALAGGGAGKAAERRPPTLTMDQVRQRAQANYQRLDNSGVSLNPNWVQAVITSVERRLLRNDRYDPSLHPEVAQTLQVMRDSIPAGTVAPVSRMEDLRKRALDLRASSDRNTQRLGESLVDELDSIFTQLPQAALVTGSRADLREVTQAVTAARRDWRNLSRAETIEEAMRRADIKSDRPTAAQAEQLRQELVSLQANRRKIRLFNEDEQAAIRNITRDGTGGKVLSWLAGFDPTRGGLRASSNAVGGMGAFASGQNGIGWASAGLMAAGWSADAILALTKNAAGRRLLQDIANGTARPPPPPEFTRGLMGGAAALQGEQE
jgi:hypothetical protein